jgi:short-subunit dehydrogenase
MVRVSQAVAQNMIDAKIKGSIVNVSSTISEVIIHILRIYLYFKLSNIIGIYYI